MNEPRVYKHSPWNWLAVAFLFFILIAGMFGMLLSGDISSTIFFSGILVLGIAASSFSLSAKTLISEDEISTQNLLGTKTLRWSEVTRVSGSGHSIKLHNFDGDVTVAPSPQVPGYEEVVEIIGGKRPDLFDPHAYPELPRNWGNLIPLAIFSLMIIGFGIFVYIESGEFIFPLIFFFVIGLVVLGMTFLSPQYVTIEGNSIIVGYLFSQKTLTADEVASITLGYMQARNGKNYYILVAKKRGGNIRISNIKPSLPIAYHVLKNWHKKNTVVR